MLSRQSRLALVTCHHKLQTVCFKALEFAPFEVIEGHVPYKGGEHTKQNINPSKAVRIISRDDDYDLLINTFIEVSRCDGIDIRCKKDKGIYIELLG